jgi:hypothetical protein
VSETWYRVKKYDNGIIPVEVIRETPHQLVYLEKMYGGGTRENRSSKISAYDKYFKTFEEAKQYVIGRLEGLVETYRKSLKNAKDELEKAHAL